MDWLSDNPVANMPGRQFLVLYGVVIAITLTACYSKLRGLVATLADDDRSPSRDTDWDVRSSEEIITACWSTRFLAALVIGGLGGYKLLLALWNGRYNVLFLILMASVALWFVFTMSPAPDRDSQS